VTVATQIGAGAYTQAALTSNKLILSIPDGETNYSVAFLCPSPTVGPFVNKEYVNQASTLDGKAFSETCPQLPLQGGNATAEVDASAIPGAEGISIGDQGCSACNTFSLSEGLADGAFVPLALGGITAATQYMAMPPGTYQSGDYYDFIVLANDTTSGGTVSVESYTSSAGPQSFTFPPPWSYAGPTAAALPTFNFAYSGFSGMSNVSYQATLDWGLGTTTFGIPEDFDGISMSATANYQNGSTAMTIPDLSSLTGFLPTPPSGTAVRWSAEVSQGDPFLTSTPSGTIQSADNSGSYAKP
jgi:hypothetical protein